MPIASGMLWILCALPIICQLPQADRPAICGQPKLHIDHLLVRLIDYRLMYDLSNTISGVWPKTVVCAVVTLSSSLGLMGCKSHTIAPLEPGQRQALAMLMPSRIEIVKPFTRVRSFDGDREPDGIELLMQAVNPLDNPGLMIVGDITVELYEFIPASADQKGQRIDMWEIELRSKEDQKRYWNEITQMYEFRLGVDSKLVPAAKRYVLAVTYHSPLGQHLMDEFQIDYRIASGPLGGMDAGNIGE